MSIRDSRAAQNPGAVPPRDRPRPARQRGVAQDPARAPAPAPAHRQPVELRPGEGVVERALRTVLHERRDQWSRAALSDDEAQRLAGVLLVFLRTGRIVAEGSLSGAEKSLIRRLVDLTRKEILERDYGLNAAATVAVVRDLEGVTDAFEGTWSQSLASGLTGASALDLVVELAHDLRSPLTSIMFLSETLRKGQSGEINEVQRKQLGIVYSAALGLVTMATDLMDLARERNDSNFERIEPARFSLAELIESVRLMVLPMAEEKRLDLGFFSPDHDIRLGKSVPLGRVLLNLLTNAIKFTETGRVEIVAHETTGCRVEFSVRDTGAGMSEEAVATMFEPYQRSHSSTGFHFSGTGLGLSICRRMVELLGGELKVDSRPGTGTRFHFEIELPRASRI
ncbi:MAG TPA: HAMP domain-containing sensor histidine kinase [Gemmatimonadota bacterium]|nr:HAMP domain-containing sensor histidine kinase [Gemmatimonadota bacterium]